jgi:hypothetical protein
LLQFGNLLAPTGRLCRVFISHAGEDKRYIVAFLHEVFKERYPEVEVFLDEESLTPGGAALPGIHAALGDAFVGDCPLLSQLEHVRRSCCSQSKRTSEQKQPCTLRPLIRGAVKSVTCTVMQWRMH